ncbi:MAG: hypothetical protein V8T23_04850 [Prevotella sp.]
MKSLAIYEQRFPIRLLYGNICIENVDYYLPTIYPAKLHWGQIVELDESFAIHGNSTLTLKVGWISLQSQKSFYYENTVQLNEQIQNSDTNTLIVGLASTGEIALWLNHKMKSVVLAFDKAVEITKLITDKMVKEAMILLPNNKYAENINQICLSDIDKFKKVITAFDATKEASDVFFNKLMQQFCYRYEIQYTGNDQNQILDLLHESLFDGTHDKLNNGELLKHHQAGKPKKLALKWHIGKSEYSAYFWFEEEPIREVFDKFYGAHPDTKTDFIIRIDAEKRKYELALYRYGLKEPQIIPQEVYQLLVFKNKFEDYRSDNYNQERGAWIW